MTDIVIAGAQPWGGEACDVVVRDGRIAARSWDIETCLELATFGGAQAMGATDYGLEPGCRADLVLVEGETAAEAVCTHPCRRMVMTGGRVVVKDGASLIDPP